MKFLPLMAILFTHLCFSKVYHQINILSINSAITPATFQYLEQNIKEDDSHLSIIKLNTPGGLVSTTKSILTHFGTVKQPIIIWITPEGASASSAGAIISSSAHFLFMSPGTNIGAATPISGGKDLESDIKAKSINDLVALTSDMAKLRKRNSDEFKLMITKAKSLGSVEALEKKVIDAVVSNLDKAINFMRNKDITIGQEKVKIEFSENLEIIHVKKTIGQKVIEFFADPNFAYILFLIGAALIYFELQAPGGLLAGSFGVICLILAGIGFQILPISIGSLGLIIVSFILFSLEVFITSYGLISIAGAIALVIGSLGLFDTQNSYMSIHKPIIFSSLSAILIYIGLIAWIFLRDRKRFSEQLFLEHVGSEGIISKKINNEFYLIKINGETWKASSSEELSLGDQVKVTSENKEKLYLEIKKL